MARSALITGGTGGLGSAVTHTFLDAGWRVVVPLHDEAGRGRVPQHERLVLQQADLFDAGAAAAVLAFVDVLATEYRDDGIRANAILPSVIATPANRARDARRRPPALGVATADRRRRAPFCARTAPASSAGRTSRCKAPQGSLR